MMRTEIVIGRKHSAKAGWNNQAAGIAVIDPSILSELAEELPP